MARKRIQVHNPAETLLIINGGKGVTRRKTTNRRRPAPARPAATNRRKTAPNRRKRGNSTAIVFSGQRAPQRPQAGNPSRRRRRRNPQVGGLVMNSLYAAAGAMVTNIVYGFIPFKPQGLLGVGVKFGAAYITGYIAERFMNPQKAQMMAVGGAASAAGDLIQQLMGTVQGFGASIFAPRPAPAEVGGLYDVGDLVPAPPFYDNGVGGLGDIVEAPGFYQYQ